MKLAPRKARTAPDAVATEFMVTTSSRGTTSGSAADRPDMTNRDRPLVSSAAISSGNFAGADGQNRADPGDQDQAAGVRADEHQPSIPSVHQRPGERAQQRVGQEQHREGARDRHRVGGSVGIEKQRSRQPRLEQPFTELTRHAHLQQSPEIGHAAHRPPQVDGCARVHPGFESQNQLPTIGRARGCAASTTVQIFMRRHRLTQRRRLGMR